ASIRSSLTAGCSPTAKVVRPPSDMPEAAIRFFTIVTNLKPAEAAGYNNLASTLRGMGKYDEAIEVLRTAVNLEPENPKLWNTLGIAAQDGGHPAEALTFYQEALRLDPGFAEAQANIGVFLLEEGRFAEAVDPLTAAIRLDPGDARAHFNHSIALAAVGRFAEAWEEYEWRHDPVIPSSSFHHHDFPTWDNEDISDKGLLICTEQGIGDDIQFASMYRETIPLAGHCLIECDPRLTTLYRRSFPGATPIPSESYQKDGKRHRTYPFLQSDPPIEYAIVAGSLTRKFRQTKESFQGHTPYLVPDPQRVELWRQRLDELGPGLKVGVCWRSMMMTVLRKKFYSEIEEWRPVFEVPGIEFVNLQYDDCTEELALMKENFGATLHVWEDTNLKDDLETVAALISELDLVITAGTMIHAMAGALDVPTWLFGLHKHDGYRWYDKLEIFSQAEAGGRKPLFENIAKALAERVAEPVA
ncbi:MAG: tetratricopeptide repeat protein, partial [Rhodospirillales bacterium]|nr:tetratricopeptide repeat protein [Rhodospirillales bacterium]